MKLERRDWAWALLLVGMSLVVRLAFARAVVFPPLDDPAFYLTTAENLIAGRGLEVDVLWSYQIPFADATHPSHEHWMPLTTWLMAAAFAVLGPSLRAGQLPGILLGSALAPLTYLWGRRFLPRGRQQFSAALTAGLLVALNATLSYQSVSADSSAPFALLAAFALAFAGRRRLNLLGCAACGVLIGLAYLTRSDGLLLLLAVPLAWGLLPARSSGADPQGRDAAPPRIGQDPQHDTHTTPSSSRRAPAGWICCLGMIIACIATAAPWLARNLQAFGTPFPGSVLRQAWLADYLDTFNYWHHPTWESYLAQGGWAILRQQGEALLHNGSAFLLATFPWGILALPGLWLLRRERAVVPASIYGLLLIVGLALAFPVSSRSGTFYHSLGALIPFLVLAAIYALQQSIQRLRRNPRFARPAWRALTLALVVLAGAQTVTAVPTAAERHRAEKAQFEAAAEWLSSHTPPGAVVMTTQPYTLNYVSDRPCIALPGNEPPDAAWDAAQRYSARVLVITETSGRYPEVLHAQPDQRFRYIDAVAGSEIYGLVTSPERPPTPAGQGLHRTGWRTAPQVPAP